MYSGTVASYRYGRTIRGHYPYVATRQSILDSATQVQAVAVSHLRHARRAAKAGQRRLHGAGLIAWVTARSGLETEAIQPPPGGRAPGWQAGLVVARRQDEEAARSSAMSREHSDAR